MRDATIKVIGKILISKAFRPSISAGFGPLGAYKIKSIELITPHPNVAAPVIKKPSLLPRFVEFIKYTDPVNTINEPINIKIPVTVKLADKRERIISRIRTHSS
jgi:hypothetical protein